MNTILVILLVLAMRATVYVLVRGVIAMASGPTRRRWSSRNERRRTKRRWSD